MRILTIPADISTKGLNGFLVEKLSFYDFFLSLVAPRFSLTTTAEVSVLESLATKLENVVHKDIVELTDEDYIALQVALPVVQGGSLIRMLGFYSAVASAPVVTKEDIEKKAKAQKKREAKAKKNKTTEKITKKTTTKKTTTKKTTTKKSN